MSEQVQTMGSESALGKVTDGSTSPKPNGGGTSHPVKKTITSVRVGALSPCSVESETYKHLSKIQA